MNKYKVFYKKTGEYFYLNDEDPFEEQLKNIFKRKDRNYNIKINMDDFIINENLCEGCLCDSLSQRDHILCPYGCLHDKKICNLC